MPVNSRQTLLFGWLASAVLACNGGPMVVTPGDAAWADSDTLGGDTTIAGGDAAPGDSTPGDGTGDSTPGDSTPTESVTILRDVYGVPHVFAATAAAAFYGWAWTEAEDNPDGLALRLYNGIARATAKSPTCVSCVGADLNALIQRVPEAATAGVAVIDPEARELLQAYVDGANAYFAQLAAPDIWDPAEPFTVAMVIGAMINARISHARSATQANLQPGGSNQFAITGAITAADTTIVLKDPHNIWGATDPYVHMQFEDYDLVGNGGIGSFGCGSNNFIGYGCTRAAPATAVSVELPLQFVSDNPGNADCGGYAEYTYTDHATGTTPFNMRCVSVTDDSGVVQFATWLYESRFGAVEDSGPDTTGDGHPEVVYANHVFAGTDPTVANYILRATLRDAAGYFALHAAPTPREDAQYRAFGSAQHEIGFVSNVAVPQLDPALDWSQPVSSTDPRIDSWTSNSDWNEMSGVEWFNVDGIAPEIPNVLAPIGDFVSNANGHPEYATEPIGQVGPVPAFLESYVGPSVRDERMRELFIGASGIDRVAAVQIAGDLHVITARRLSEAARCRVQTDGLVPATEYADGGELMQILLDWQSDDYRATPSSQAMTVMYLFDMLASPNYPAEGVCLSRSALDGMGVFLRDSVAPYMRSVYTASHVDPLRVPWGYINYVVVGGREVGLPGGGGLELASLMVSFFAFDVNTGRADPAVHGGSRLAQVTVYDSNGFEAWISPALGQGNELRSPNSPHVGQTIDDYAAGIFRRVWTQRAEVEQNLCPWGDSGNVDFDPSHEHVTTTVLQIP